jgi:hypothetical protein
VIEFKANPLLTFFYRGTMEDTAALVGLSHARANIGMIAVTEDVSQKLREYCEMMGRWLSTRGLPRISIKPQLTTFDLDHVLGCPLKDWGWEKDECVAVIRLSGLSLPLGDIP